MIHCVKVIVMENIFVEQKILQGRKRNKALIGRDINQVGVGCRVVSDIFVLVR